jgi:hypothetical protein
MKDLELAEKIIEEKSLTLVVVKEGNILFTSADRGIEPIYTAVTNFKEGLEGSGVADRVTGRAAAILCRYGKIAEIHTDLISDEAIRIFKNSGIKYFYEEYSPYIKNRDKTDMCPVEKLAYGIDNPQELIQRISEFMGSMKREV